MGLATITVLFYNTFLEIKRTHSVYYISEYNFEGKGGRGVENNNYKAVHKGEMILNFFKKMKDPDPLMGAKSDSKTFL